MTELKLLEGIVDAYLPDFKYMDSTRSARYSRAKDYPSVAKHALSEMVRQQPDVVIDDATGLIPVSYTHLDVYKIQRHTSCGLTAVHSQMILWHLRR